MRKILLPQVEIADSGWNCWLRVKLPPGVTWSFFLVCIKLSLSMDSHFSTALKTNTVLGLNAFTWYLLGILKKQKDPVDENRKIVLKYENQLREFFFSGNLWTNFSRNFSRISSPCISLFLTLVWVIKWERLRIRKKCMRKIIRKCIAMAQDALDMSGRDYIT